MLFLYAATLSVVPFVAMSDVTQTINAINTTFLHIV